MTVLSLCELSEQLLNLQVSEKLVLRYTEHLECLFFGDKASSHAQSLRGDIRSAVVLVACVFSVFLL